MSAAVDTIGGLPLLIFGVLAGVLLLHWRAAAAWGRRWLALLVMVYWAMSTLPVPLLFQSALTRGYAALESGPHLDGVSMVVVLSSGSGTVIGHEDRIGLLTRTSLARVLEAARAYRLLENARIVATGGIIDPERRDDLIPEAITTRTILTSLGVPPEHVVLDAPAENTYGQAVSVASMMRQRGADRFVLVTSPEHMPRAVRAFRAQGVSPIPAIAADTGEERRLRDYIVPNFPALQLSRRVLHEYVGLAYYWARGWLG